MLTVQTLATAHRNLHQRIAKLLSNEKLTPWQIEMIGRALADLEATLYSVGAPTMTIAERPDLYEPFGFKRSGRETIADLRRRLGELTRP